MGSSASKGKATKNKVAEKKQINDSSQDHEVALSGNGKETSDDIDAADPNANKSLSANKILDAKSISRNQGLEKKIQAIQEEFKNVFVPEGTVSDAFQRISTLGFTDTKLKVNDTLKRKFTEKKNEKSRLIIRLSEMASSRLRTNNPDIADLSDPNRATKLAEKLSELYDNEWTDTFERIKAKADKSTTEKDIIILLKNVLKFCYDRCLDIASRQRSHVLSHLELRSNVPENEIQRISPDMRLRLKEFQKAIHSWGVARAQQVIVNEIPTTKVFNAKLISKLKNDKHVIAYCNTAVEIAWFSQIQDPPMALLFEPKENDALLFFRSYTILGKDLDYVIWPVMLLNDGGSIVSKGVAQYKRIENTKAPDQNVSKEKVNDTESSATDSVW
ncbi:uncharacterized protein LOC128227415 isoform X2 [Mya arenaria]|uniref:uncharacterized protein LOC128227415 isoform X2 n=1 Tax=Mya arenaria TaxID=6604 RepID=UPI0022E31A72|nr:uncharacterized protein LOC128227415 isoform X2 [Mya arenaria]XP_052793889.1 uncharacterized protein LOC128227415 isoform X2 [Mya arenaria]